MFRFLGKAFKIATFTIAPAVAGWYLVYIINHPWVDHTKMTMYWSPIWNWVIFLVAVIITITGYVLDIRKYCKNRKKRSNIRTEVDSDRRFDKTRINTGRRSTDK
jgi:p-aminobenzoyl-glutamate transporter AbgT